MTIHVVATAHGTDSPEGRETINSIRFHLERLLDEKDFGAYQVHEAYVDVQEPELDTVVAELPNNEQTVILPLLLSTGFHTQVDMQRAAKNSGTEDIRVAPALGPSPILAQHLATRLREAEWTPGEPVVLAGSGSSRADGRAAVQEQANLLSQELNQTVTFGFVADIDPKLGDQLAEGTYIATYLMGRGFFDSKVNNTASAAGALATAPLVVPGDDAAAQVLAQVALEKLEQALA